jgi:citrate lyase subunit beta/citryl-CoA lyase
MAGLDLSASSARTFLFAPGDRPERFAKAAASGPDLVVFDLEDAVADDRKEQARGDVAACLDAGVAGGVRINPPGTPWYDNDVAMVAERRCVVMLPKAQDAAGVAGLAAHLTAGSPIIALVETARGILNAAAIAAAPAVVRLAFGSFDLAAQLGVSPDDRDAMAAARGALVLASAAAGLPAPVDGITGNIHDEGALRDDVEFARRMGFTGKLCIHPRQVSAAAAVLGPSPDEVSWAQAVLRAASAAAATGAGVVVADGVMVDKPVMEHAERIVAQARRPSAPWTEREHCRDVTSASTRRS